MNNSYFYFSGFHENNKQEFKQYALFYGKIKAL